MGSTLLQLGSSSSKANLSKHNSSPAHHQNQDNTRPSGAMPGFTDLSRELIDNIISELIFLHDHDPAYQWTCLRTITPYHKSLIEHHFRHFWIPKLTFTIRLNERYENSLVSFTTQPDNQANSQSEHKELLKHHSDKYLTFERKEDYEEVSFQLDDDLEDWLEEVVVAAQRSPRECEHSKSIIVRFGEGTLNKGFTHGGIFNDILVPGVTFNFEIDPWTLSFDWKALFDLLFDEEIQFRRFRDKLLEDFMPTIKKITTLQARQAAIYKFLQQRYHWERRQMILAYREHMASQQLQPHAQPFDLTPYLPHQREIGSAEARLLTSDHFYEILNQQSLVFQIPGWETWSVRDIARLRIMDELIEEGMFPRDSMGYAGACYFEEMKVREEEMMGKREASEEMLEEYLRGPALDPRRFMDW